MLNCPACAASLRFDIESQKLRCSHCDNAYDPYLFDDTQSDAVIKKESSESTDFKTYEAAVWICPGCGAEITCADMTDITSVCAYCGNQNIIFDRIKNERFPESIIPFSITKDECIREYQKASRRAFLSTPVLRNKEQVDSFRGIYMPFWSYESHVEGNLKISSNAHKRQSGDYEITDYDRSTIRVKADIPTHTHDASRQFDDDISEALVPFRKKDERPFTPGYLCGFYAETDDVSSEEHQETSAAMTQYVLEEEAKRQKLVKGIILKNETSIPKTDFRASRRLFPVWFMSCRMRNGTLAYAAVNGNTGKVSGDFPISFFRTTVFMLLMTAAIFGLLSIIPGFMIAPVPAFGITLLLFYGGELYYTSTLKKLLLRIDSERWSQSEEKTQRILKVILYALFFIIFQAFSVEKSYGFLRWLVFLTGFVVFLISDSRLKSCQNILEGADLEKQRVSYKDYKKFKASIIINKVLIYFIFFVCTVLFNMVVDVMNENYYILSTVVVLSFLIQFISAIFVNRTLTTRRPPQFKKKGGDDNA